MILYIILLFQRNSTNKYSINVEIKKFWDFQGLEIVDKLDGNGIISELGWHWKWSWIMLSSRSNAGFHDRGDKYCSGIPTKNISQYCELHNCCRVIVVKYFVSVSSLIPRLVDTLRKDMDSNGKSCFVLDRRQVRKIW